MDILASALEISLICFVCFLQIWWLQTLEEYSANCTTQHIPALSKI